MKENRKKGVLFAAPTVPVTMLGWVILWELGILASVVAWGSALLAIRLYEKGAGKLTKDSIKPLWGIVLASLVLSFLAGMASDAAHFYSPLKTNPTNLGCDPSESETTLPTETYP